MALGEAHVPEVLFSHPSAANMSRSIASDDEAAATAGAGVAAGVSAGRLMQLETSLRVTVQDSMGETCARVKSGLVESICRAQARGHEERWSWRVAAPLVV
jgi:hypothetical protein